jgi:hypothetical protein
MSQRAPAVGTGAEIYNGSNAAQVEGDATGIKECDRVTGISTTFHVMRSNECDDTESAACLNTTVCRDADTTDLCDAPERCVGPTSPICYSDTDLRRSSLSDMRFRMNVSGLPQVCNTSSCVIPTPKYPAFVSGGSTSNFVAAFDFNMPTSLEYTTTNPPILADVDATCNSVRVAFRAKFYWVWSDTSMRPECGSTQAEDRWAADIFVFMRKDLNGTVQIRDASPGSWMTLVDASGSTPDLQGKFVSVFAHIFEPKRNESGASQTGLGPYAGHACLAKYFVDGSATSALEPFSLSRGKRCADRV